MKNSETPRENLRRIATEQIDKALTEIDTDDLDRHERVHQVRKRLKKLRALIRLYRGELSEIYTVENREFRDAGRLLSEARDAHTMLETVA